MENMTEEQEKKVMDMVNSRDVDMIKLGLTILIKYLSKKELSEVFPKYFPAPDGFLKLFNLHRSEYLPSLRNFLIISGKDTLHCNGGYIIYRPLHEVGSYKSWKSTDIIEL